jgi:hypothetical protein
MAQNYISPMAQTNNTQLQSRVTPAIWNNRQQRNGNNGQTGTRGDVEITTWNNGRFDVREMWIRDYRNRSSLSIDAKW